MEKNELKILSIDDHPDNLISLKALIREAFPDAITLTAENGPDGISLAKSEDPDVILLDVVMPGMDGFEVCQKLKADPRTGDIPVVFVTALKGDKQSRIQALEVGAEAFLAKPIDETELTVQIRAMVKIKAANNQKRHEKENLTKLVYEKTRELNQAHTTALLLVEDLKKENEARKQNEVDLQKANKFLEEAQRISHLGNWEWDLITNQSTWSSELYQIYGRDQEMGTPSIDHGMENIHPDDRISLQNAIQSAMISGNYQINYRILRYDNAQIRWIHAEGEVTFRDGKPVSLHGVAQDITERKQAEEAKHLSEERYRLLYERAGVGIAYYSPEGVIFSYNAIAAAHMGGKPEDFSGKSISDIFPKAAADVYMDRVRKAAASGSVQEYEDKVDLPGETRWFVSAFSRILDTSNQISGVQIISTDISQLKQTEEALRKSETQLRAVLDATPFPIALVDVEDNQIDYWSQSALSLFGHTAPTAGEWYQIAYPDANYRNEVIARWKPALEKAQGSQRAINTGEYRVSCEDGSVRICELYASFLRDKLIVTFNDITERRQAEEALRENQMMLANIFDSVPQNIFWKDLAGVYLGCNQNFAQTAGLTSPDQIIGKTDYDLPWPRAAADAYRADDQEVIHQNTPKRHIIETVRTANGSSIWADTTKIPLLDATGKPYGILGVYEDITERKQTEEALRESEIRFRTLFDHAAVGVALVETKTSRYTDINQKYCDFLGYTREEMLGKTFVDVTHPDDVPLTLEKNALLLAGEINEFTIEKRYFRKDGTLVWGALTASPMWKPGETPAVNYHIIVVQDITEQMRVKNMLIESGERFRLLFESMESGFALHEIICDDQGVPCDYRFLEINPAFEELTGLKAESLIGHTCMEMMPDTEKEWVERYGKVALTGEAVNFESYARELGKYYHVIAYSPRNKQFAVIFQDITERKQASQIVLESKERLNRAENIGRLGNWEYDTTNYHIIWSDQVYEMYERDPQLGPPTEAEESRYYSEADSQRLRGYAQNAINRGEPITDYEFQVNLPSGSSRIFSGSMFPIKDENSKVIKIFGVFQDITERKLAEQKINEQLDELRRWYSAMLGREERTMELKKEVNELLAQAGQPLRYTESL